MAKFKLIIILCILILLSSFAFAATEMCFQESANDSTVTATNPIILDGDCGIYNGSYGFTVGVSNPNNAIDGDYGTIVTGAGENITINYTKPLKALGMVWFVKTVGSNIDNITIPDICFNAFTDKVFLQVGIDTAARVNFYCWNTTDMEFLSDIGSSSNIFAEEGVFWNVTKITNLSLTFIDEVSNTKITGETFTVFLKKSDFSQTFSSTTNPFVIPNLDVDLFTKLKVSSTNYPGRQYFNIDLRGGTRSSPVNFTVYLINNTLGSEVTFNIVLEDGLAPLEGVRTVFTKSINGIDTVVSEEDSDFAGQVVLDLDEDTQYTITFTRTGLQDRTILLEPKNPDYLIQMVSTVGAYNQSVHEGIRYRFEPSNTVLNNNTKFNFTFTLNSTVWPITNCTLRLKNGTTLLNESSSFTSSSCFISIELDTSDMTNITSEAIYELNSEFEFTVTHQYKIIFTYVGQFSLKNFLDDLSNFGMAGFDDFGRMMLALVVIFIITALATKEIVGFTSFTNPEVLIILVIAQVWLFSFVNWLFLDFAPIPTIAGFDLKKYIIAILVTMAGGAFLIEKFSKG